MCAVAGGCAGSSASAVSYIVSTGCVLLAGSGSRQGYLRMLLQRLGRASSEGLPPILCRLLLSEQLRYFLFFPKIPSNLRPANLCSSIPSMDSMTLDTEPSYESSRMELRQRSKKARKSMNNVISIAFYSREYHAILLFHISRIYLANCFEMSYTYIAKQMDTLTRTRSCERTEDTHSLQAP